MDAFGECYEVEALDNGLVRLRWTVIMNLTGVNRLTAPFYGFFMKPLLSSWLKRLKRIMETEF